MKIIAIGTIAFLLLVTAVFAQAPQLPTPQVSGCDSLLKLNASNEIILDYEKAKTIEIEVLNARCAASHVYLDIEGIRPDIIFTLSPDFYLSVPPNQSVKFNLTFPPGNALNKTEYDGIYWIRTNNKWFNAGEVKIKTMPAAEIKNVTNEQPAKKESLLIKQLPAEVKKNAAPIVILALLMGIFGGAYYYFKKK